MTDQTALTEIVCATIGTGKRDSATQSRATEIRNKIAAMAAKAKDIQRPAVRPGVCPVCRGVGWLRQDLPLGHPDFGKYVPCECLKPELERRNFSTALGASGLDRMTGQTFAAFDPAPSHRDYTDEHRKSLAMALLAARKFAADPVGWLTITGNPGTGKSHLAAAIGWAVAGRVLAMFVTLPDLLDELRSGYDNGDYQERLRQVKEIALLIADDFATQNVTSWAYEKLFQIFNYRYSNRLPTVITTNALPSEIEPRLASRMNDKALGKTVAIIAPDYRTRVTRK